MYDSEIRVSPTSRGGTFIENGQCYVDGVRRAAEYCKDIENIALGATIFGIIFTIVMFLIFAGFAGLWIFTLIHVIKNEDVKDRTLWIVLHFVGLNLLAAPIYYFAVLKPYNTSKQIKQNKSNSTKLN